MASPQTIRSKKAKTPPFAMVFLAMWQSANFRALGPWSRCVLLELMMQYRGKNNGNLSATRTMAKEWGIASDNTLRKALTELEAGGWIIQTRSSVFSRHGARCALYALSWFALDECPGKNLEIGPTRTPPRTIRSLTNSTSFDAENAHGTAQKVRT
ncbi:hypothetical protein LS633_02655 [Pseudomonas sp. NIBR-H-19]|uniref:hypothetical protein n=1 Tax=Pseudomonas sp. NIBR-H-19 TaxID=2901380 RepID=UPI001E30F397|nr:hypothetical protein [Pseudomonas sp. NIBR-H-19]UHC82754.1 hypothetical protein LS633_02655 [Pseudomonas sp. NIBR-H-19]